LSIIKYINISSNYTQVAFAVLITYKLVAVKQRYGHHGLGFVLHSDFIKTGVAAVLYLAGGGGENLSLGLGKEGYA
jgi:hypothetical protein